MSNWIKNYFHTLYELQLNTRVTDKSGNSLSLEAGFSKYIQHATTTQTKEHKILFIGNGGSAGIASHLAIDYSKNGGLPSMAFSDSAALTCLSNDYGYEYVFSKQLEFHAKKGDLLVAISSSGKSINILNAVKTAHRIGCAVITFSGFDPQNPLSQLGDINFYINSTAYGFVEVAHLGLGHSLLDYIIEEKLNQIQHDELVSSI